MRKKISKLILEMSSVQPPGLRHSVTPITDYKQYYDTIVSRVHNHNLGYELDPPITRPEIDLDNKLKIMSLCATTEACIKAGLTFSYKDIHILHRHDRSSPHAYITHEALKVHHLKWWTQYVSNKVNPYLREMTADDAFKKHLEQLNRDYYFEGGDYHPTVKAYRITEHSHDIIKIMTEDNRCITLSEYYASCPVPPQELPPVKKTYDNPTIRIIRPVPTSVASAWINDRVKIPKTHLHFPQGTQTPFITLEDFMNIYHTWFSSRKWGNYPNGKPSCTPEDATKATIKYLLYNKYINVPLTKNKEELVYRLPTDKVMTSVDGFYFTELAYNRIYVEGCGTLKNYLTM